MHKKTVQHNPLVTVLMSTYNRPHTLRKALASALNQTWPNLEVILVRDGGLCVRQAIAEFLNDPRFVFIDRPTNRGKAHSFNEALGRARGEFVCYLDDDDLFYPFHVETLATALLEQPAYQAAYTDLYKVHCRQMPDGRRIVLAKNVEVTRDFDRMVMLQFNQALHVSLMHRRDLFQKTGLYNENIKVLIDWDLTRRLCFFTDLLHIPVVTGEFYAPIEDCDRISVQRRKNVNDYLWNLLTIRSTRPAKPWPCIRDLAVVVPFGQPAEREQTLRDLWGHSFYPCRYYVPLTPAQQSNFNSSVPNVVPITVSQDASAQSAIDAALAVCEGEFTAIVPNGIRPDPEEVSFVERSLQPLLQSDHRGIAYELVEATPDNWGAVMRTEELIAARRRWPQRSVADSLRSAGVEMCKPKIEDYPFQFDNFINFARQREREGDWLNAVKFYDYLADKYGNVLWMQTLKANALYYAGRYQQAAQLAGRLNQTHPTVARLMIEGRARQKINDFSAAATLYRRAAAILDGSDIPAPPPRIDPSPRTPSPALRQQETLAWTS